MDRVVTAQGPTERIVGGSLRYDVLLIQKHSKNPKVRGGGSWFGVLRQQGVSQLVYRKELVYFILKSLELLAAMTAKPGFVFSLLAFMATFVACRTLECPSQKLRRDELYVPEISDLFHVLSTS